MKKKNPEAFGQMAKHYKNGEGTFQSDTKSLEMRICAAELGLANAFDHIGYSYQEGIVVEQDMSKALEFYEVGAKKGSILAHHNLASFHGTNGNIQVCIKHLKVVASTGDQDSMDYLMKLYKRNKLSKEDLAQTLSAFQTAKNAMKSKDREDAHDLIARYNNRDR